MAVPERSQAFVPVEEVRSGVVSVKGGGYRGILLCSSINFALKSEDEQRAIIGGFQNFLNTLDFSVQVLIHSRKTDIRPYLSYLAGLEDEQKTDLMKIQLREYTEFIRNFIEGTNIMTKTFYLVVPYAATASVGKAAGLFARGKAPSADSSFDEDRVQLEQRMALVASGLSNCGIRAAPLGTEELIELLYRSFNPGALENSIKVER
jgi:hypothetical protein